MNKRLYRSRKDKMIAGVAGGIAEYFKIDPTIVRVIIVLLAFSTFEFFVVAYIIAAIVIPEKPKDYVEDEDEVEVLDEDGTTVEKKRDSKQVLGLFFVGAGAMMLLTRTISWFDSSMILAVGIIAVGIYVLVRRDHKDD